MGQSTLARGGESSPLKWCVALVLVLALASPRARADETPAEKPDNQQSTATAATPLPPIVCLRTEFLPWRLQDKMKFRLMRELGRQALLIAARDELGLATRDETLGEEFPAGVVEAKQDLTLIVRSQYDGRVDFQIWRASEPGKPNPAFKRADHDPKAILNQTEKLEPLIHSGLCQILREKGFDGKAAPANEKNLPPDSVEGRLLEMNFVSQFAAVRAAHAAIAEKGQSRAWLGVLARGYANLAFMTAHHWKSDSEAFAARGLLYAERLVAAASDDSQAHATRAYVRAIVGLHGAALDELARAQELKKQRPDQKDLPGWLDVVEPYCRFEREPLHSIVERRPSLRQLAQRLSFEQVRAFGDDRWLFESAKQTIALSPEEYGIYTALTQASASLLSVVRTGAFYAPAALGHFLPQRIADLENVPGPVRDAARGVIEKNKKQAKDGDAKSKTEGKPSDTPAESAGEYAGGTIPIVDALRAATRAGNDKGEPTWSALGELIFEEQFVQAANYLNVSLNATESSHDEEVKSMAHAIKGHRFARYIEGFSAATLGNTQNYFNLIGDMPITDARGNMQHMITRIWAIDHQNGIQRGSEAAWYASFDNDLTFNGLLESYNAFSYVFWNQNGKENQKQWANDFQVISPHSPQALRLAIKIVPKPSFEQLTQWESQAGEDPHAYRSLGDLFGALAHYEDAFRVYERSIALSPSKDAFVGLANAYRAAGQENMWLPTLERFFEVESLGLEHAQVHSIIAYDLIDKDKLVEAQPHAAAAAETGSNWGLLLAGRVEERLGHWDDSEKYIREAAEYYPTSSGPEWYFWCRRTGRGELGEARKLAQAYFTMPSTSRNAAGPIQRFTFDICENDVRAALADMKKVAEVSGTLHMTDEDMVRCPVQLANVELELKDKDALKSATEDARQLIEKFREKSPGLAKIYSTICDVQAEKPPSDKDRAEIDKEVEKLPADLRTNCYYFLGRAYDLAGNKELSEKYWKDCITRGPYDRYPATLAGKYLCDRHKTSRP